MNGIESLLFRRQEALEERQDILNNRLNKILHNQGREMFLAKSIELSLTVMILLLFAILVLLLL